MAAHNRLRFDGLDELRAALQRLPAELTGEAAQIVVGAAEGTARETDAIYAQHVHTGTLQARLSRATTTAGRFGTAAAVSSRAPHAWLFEHGSHGARRTTTNANRGAMPAEPAVIPAAVRQRDAMYDRLRALLQAHGFEVRGG